MVFNFQTVPLKKVRCWIPCLLPPLIELVYYHQSKEKMKTSQPMHDPAQKLSIATYSLIQAIK